MVESPAAVQEVAGSSLLRGQILFLTFFVNSLTKSPGNLNTFKIVRDRFLDDYIKYNGL